MREGNVRGRWGGQLVWRSISMRTLLGIYVNYIKLILWWVSLSLYMYIYIYICIHMCVCIYIYIYLYLYSYEVWPERGTLLLTEEQIVRDIMCFCKSSPKSRGFTCELEFRAGFWRAICWPLIGCDVLAVTLLHCVRERERERERGRFHQLRIQWHGKRDMGSAWCSWRANDRCAFLSDVQAGTI